MLQLAPVYVPILWADFLCHHNLLLDVANQKVFCNSSPGSLAILLSSSLPMSSSLHAALLSNLKCVFHLLLEFPDVLSFAGSIATPPCHPVCPHLLTHPGPLVFAKARRRDPDKLAIAKVEFSAMASSAVQFLLGLFLSTWLRRKKAVGDLAAIIGG